MKEITAYVQKKYLKRVVQALLSAQFGKLSFTNISTLGSKSELKKANYSIEFARKYSKMVKVKLTCQEKDMHGVVEIIRRHACIYQHEDGIIFGAPMKQAVKIRTDENGKQILQI